MKITAFIIISVLAFITLFTAYLAVMNLKRSRDAGTLPKPAMVIGYPILFFGYILDVLFNWIVGSVIFLDIPREGTLSSRLNRHFGKDDWRGKVARYICHNFLDPFDPTGAHCKEKK